MTYFCPQSTMKYSSSVFLNLGQFKLSGLHLSEFPIPRAACRILGVETETSFKWPRLKNTAIVHKKNNLNAGWVSVSLTGILGNKQDTLGCFGPN